jgi:hypothetical protein
MCMPIQNRSNVNKIWPVQNPAMPPPSPSGDFDWTLSNFTWFWEFWPGLLLNPFYFVTLNRRLRLQQLQQVPDDAKKISQKIFFKKIEKSTWPKLIFKFGFFLVAPYTLARLIGPPRARLPTWHHVGLSRGKRTGTTQSRRLLWCDWWPNYHAPHGLQSRQ